MKSDRTDNENIIIFEFQVLKYEMVVSGAKLYNIILAKMK